MNSIQTKSKKYVKILDESCIAQIVAVPDKNEFVIYVAWEWEKPAKQGVFGFTKSVGTYEFVTPAAITETMRYGRDVSMEPEVKKIFKNLF